MRAPVALFEACVQAGVRRVVQLSALGADDAAASGYHRSKAAADRALAALPLEAVVVRPSLVFAPGGASARWFCMLASLPVVPLPGAGAQCVQPIHRDDLVDALVALVEADGPGNGAGAAEGDASVRPVAAILGAGPRVVDAVGPAPCTLRGYLAALRATMGLPRGWFLPVPRALVRVAGAVGARFGGFVDRDALAMLDRGNCAPADGITALLGRPPRPAEAFAAVDERAALRRRAQLDWLLPVLRVAVAATWIVTGVVSLWVFPREASLALLARTGLDGAAATLALHAGAWLDIALGAAVLVLRRRRIVYALQALLMLGYTAIITAWLPEFWLHPYGPVLKNLPLLAATWLLYALDGHAGEDRR